MQQVYQGSCILSTLKRKYYTGRGTNSHFISTQNLAICCDLARFLCKETYQEKPVLDR